MDDKTESQAEMLGNRLRKRHRHLLRWARRGGTGAFRLYDRDIPEIPLVLDYYESSPGAAALAGALYRRPYEKDPGEEEAWLARMEEETALALQIPPSRIFMRERRRLRGRAGGGQEGAQAAAKAAGGQYERLNPPAGGFEMAVGEGGLRFWVNLSAYLDTGLFLDRRLLRAFVRDRAAGRQVLNLFAYTCAFSVYAAAGGAASVDSVDISRTYLDWGRRNFALNGLEAAGGGLRAGAPFRFIRADALRFLGEAAGAGRKWDLIILDPPSFSNSKKMEGTLDIKRDHGPLLRGCLDILKPGGILIFSVNAKGFTPDRGIRITDMTEKLRDEDFKGHRIPRCYLAGRGHA
jgi:23S rRNA G2069 N7-methylase RlmK/C1962 C5-methylase RlmI